MPRTAITVQTPPGAYPGTIAADAADLTWVAADVANKNSFVCAGGELVLVRNDDASAQTVTITSVADEYARTGDVSAYSVGAGEYALFGPIPVAGWRQSDGSVYLEASSANVKLAVIRP